jgi:tRNA-Thr(GGU) m(6)t(6)A37 methyltransferase TsaA
LTFFGVAFNPASYPLHKDEVMKAYSFEPIGRIHSCFKEKFGIPRQSGLVPEAQAELEIVPPYHRAEAFRGLEDFSHIWILFVFHQCTKERVKTTVRPPRLGGNRRVGIFASRSGFRPNPIGQSVVELVGIESHPSGVWLRLKGVDLLDGTPVLDIKPYIDYADQIPAARSSYASSPPRPKPVTFSEQADRICRRLEGDAYPQLRRLIINLLAQDPRPAYIDDHTGRAFGMRLWDLNIRFQGDGDKGLYITSIERCPISDG